MGLEAAFSCNDSPLQARCRTQIRLWGFFDGFTGGAIFAWLYNLIAGRAASGQS